MSRPASSLTVCMALVAALSFAPGTRSMASASVIDLDQCHLTVLFLRDEDGSRVKAEGWLPEQYTPAEVLGHPGSSSPAIWVFDCAEILIDGVGGGSGRISLVGIQIVDRLAHDLWPTHWDHYLVWLHSDNEAVAAAASAVGLPAISVPLISFDWRADDATTTASIPWTGSPYEVSIRGRVRDVPHLHDNTFQYGDEPGAGPRLHLVIDPLVPQDRFCLSALEPGCAGVSTQPGTPMSDFLGTAVGDAGADHEVISHARIHILGRTR